MVPQTGRGFPCSSVGKESACSAGDPGSIPELGRSPGEGNGNPLQYPCLENLMDRRAWWAAVHGVAKSRVRLGDEHNTCWPQFTALLLLSCYSHVQLFSTLWIVIRQCPLSMGFSRPEYWMGCHALLQGIFPTQGLNPSLLHWQRVLYH